MIKNFTELLTQAIQKKTKRLVVAVAEDKEVLLAIKLAQEKGLIEPVLVGNASEIKMISTEIGLALNSVEVVDRPSPVEACEKAVQMVSSGAGDILMKGLVDTSLLMKTVLNKEHGLRTNRLVSHIAMIETSFLKRLIFVTDGGMNIKPDLAEKKEIVENAIEVTRKLGYELPGVAVLAAIEKINVNMPETIEAAALAKMGERGQITGGLIDGPLAIDNALSEEAARIKGIKSKVAGKADILLVPEIIAGNILGKSSIYFAGGKIAAIIGGTSKPVVVTSRANTAQIKLISIGAAVLMSN